MNYKAISAVSALALMISFSAFAAETSASGNATVTAKDGTAINDVKNGLDRAGNSMRESADDIRAFILGKDGKTFEPVLIHRNMTAHGLIGETIVNTKGEKIATVKDIIIDKEGRASLVVVSDHGVLGIGDKVAAFSYDKVLAQKTDGKVVMMLSQDMVDHAADFSYDQKDWAKAKVIPTGSISTNELLAGDVTDFEGKKMASVENVYFRGVEVTQIIVGFNKTLGLGGDLAAVDYNDLEMVKDGDDLDFKLTPNQTANFKSFKKSVAN